MYLTLATNVHIYGHSGKTMTLRIENSAQERGSVLRLSGRIASDNLDELKKEISAKPARIALDLEHITLVDVEGVRFLRDCEARGILLIQCSPYIREWMLRERER